MTTQHKSLVYDQHVFDDLSHHAVPSTMRGPPMNVPGEDCAKRQKVANMPWLFGNAQRYTGRQPATMAGSPTADRLRVRLAKRQKQQQQQET